MKATRFNNVLTVALIAGLAATAGTADAKQVGLDVSMANPLLEAGKKQVTYLKVGLTGFDMSSKKRAPVNVALVIDKSGSMGGDKIQKAKQAALAAVDRMDKDDIVSVVAYDSSVRVLVPATKVSDRAAIRRGINQLTAGGSTALFAGVSKGAREIRKFLEEDRVNRVILLSDGLANVGPDSPGELGDLGASLAKERISVTTIGLGTGYNEDLMTQLARRSDGNHAFVEHSRDLARIFNYEFGDILSVVAQEITVRIKCARGIRPVRVLGRTAEISGRDVHVSLTQLYSKQEKYIMLEVEVPEGRHGRAQDIASVEVAYANMDTKTTDTLKSEIAVRFTEDEEEVVKKTNNKVMADAVLHVATAVNKKALKLRDQGKVAEAKSMLKNNTVYLKSQAKVLKSEKLSKYGDYNDRSASNLGDRDWDRERKLMREEQMQIEYQRSY